MDFNTFRNRIQQEVIRNNHQGVIDGFREFIGGQDVAQEMFNAMLNNIINNINLDNNIDENNINLDNNIDENNINLDNNIDENNINLDNIVDQLQDTFYKMDSLSKKQYENSIINKQIKIIERSIIERQQFINELCKQETKTHKDMLKYNTKISELNHDRHNLQKYGEKLTKIRSNLCDNVLTRIINSNTTINDSIRKYLDDIGQGLRLPEDLERGYEPDSIDKRQISKVLEDTKKTFNEVNSTINEIDMELQEVSRQINDINHQ